ncbi:MAG: YkgJ family cysteine cluster protein [Lachnospiraceae bacterium]
MKRNVTMEEISDGKLYDSNDLVKADCGGCKDCSACCHGMGNSIVLDPLDLYNLTTHLKCSFEQLMNGYIELNLVDGIILPNLKMNESRDCCSFLNENGRCSIHPFRPSICRLFPLGRYYENNSFRYFLQIHECQKEQRSKIKVKKWIDTPNLKQNEQFISTWHYFLKDLQEIISHSQDEGLPKKISMVLLQIFYLQPYDSTIDFYAQFDARLKTAKETFMQQNILSESV